MKIIVAAMAAVIVILVVPLGAALMDKADTLIQEEPTRAAPNPKHAITGDENRQRQSQDQHEIERLRRDVDRMQDEADRRESDREWDCIMEGGSPRIGGGCLKQFNRSVVSSFYLEFLRTRAGGI